MSNASQLVRVGVIVGPTASGKTALAIALAEAGLPIEIVGCDALQLYQELDAATAKPTAQQRAAVPYHCVDCVAPTVRLDAAAYARLADVAIADIVARGKWPVIVGGTGLYLRAVLEGLAQMPQVPAHVRQALADQWADLGPAAMHERLRGIDPVYAEKTPAANRQRVLRALEIHAVSGRPFSSFHADQPLPQRYDAAIVVLQPPREQLREKITQRAEGMAMPLLAECRKLLDRGLSQDHHATQAIGYRQALDMIQHDRVDVATLANALVVAHRKYAKRQRTWFARLDADTTITAPDPAIAAAVNEVAALFSRFFGVSAASQPYAEAT